MQQYSRCEAPAVQYGGGGGGFCLLGVVLLMRGEGGEVLVVGRDAV